MNKIIYLTLIVAFNVFASNDIQNDINTEETQSDSIIVNNDSQTRYHQSYKSNKSDNFFNVIYVVNKNNITNETSVELIVTTKSGQIIINESNEILIGDSRFDDYNLKDFGSVTKSQVFFSDSIFQEYLDLKLPNLVQNEKYYLNKFNNIVDSFNEETKIGGGSDCDALITAINQAFAYLQYLISIGGNAKGFYMQVIVPMLNEVSFICLAE